MASLMKGIKSRFDTNPGVSVPIAISTSSTYGVSKLTSGDGDFLAHGYGEKSGLFENL
jgi:hypothetical protein